jgi:hypothetical protein
MIHGSIFRPAPKKLVSRGNQSRSALRQIFSCDHQPMVEAKNNAVEYLG